MKHFIFGSNSPSPKRRIFKQVFFLLFMATAAVITPCGAQTETDYELEVAGVKVTSKNCSDLSVIEGVSGRVGYDPYENYLFLYDAKIESKNGVPVSWQRRMWKFLWLETALFRQKMRLV